MRVLVSRLAESAAWRSQRLIKARVYRFAIDAEGSGDDIADAA